MWDAHKPVIGEFLGRSLVQRTIRDHWVGRTGLAYIPEDERLVTYFTDHANYRPLLFALMKEQGMTFPGVSMEKLAEEPVVM